MAFVDSNQETPYVATNQSAPVSSGGAGIAGTATKPSANTPGVNVPAQPSAQLSAYLNANAPQAQGMAQQIASNVSGQVSNATSQILPAVNTYTGQLTNVPTNATVNQEVANSPSSLSAADQATYEQELAAANNTPNSAATFETTQPYANLASEIQNAVNNANVWNVGNNPNTISTALQPFESPGTTQGDSTLDALLLSQTPEAAQTLQTAAQGAQTAQSQLASGASTADTALQNAIAQDQAATQAATQAGNEYVTNLTNYLNQTVATAQAAALQGNDSILKDLQNNTLTPADQAILGISNDQLAGLENQLQLAETPQNVISQGAGQYAGQTPTQQINLLAYLNQQDPNAVITDANTATAQNYADVAALQNMMGSATPNTPITSSTASQAGTAPTALGINSFNTTGALDAAINASANDRAIEQTYLNEIQNGSDQAHALAAAQNVAKNETEAGLATAGILGGGVGALGGMGGAALAEGLGSGEGVGMLGAGLAAGGVGAAVALLAVALIPGAAQWIGVNEGAIANGFEDFGNDIVSFFSGW